MDRRNWDAAFAARFERHEDELKWLYCELYHNDMQAYKYFVGMLYRAWQARPEALRRIDEAREALGDLKPAEHIVLHHDDVKAVNTEENPNEVQPVRGRNGKMDGGRMNVKLPALSWNVIRLTK